MFFPAVFFVRAPRAVTTANCSAVAAELQRTTGLSSGDVRLRNDRWFITSPEMPVRYPFWDWAPPPGPVEFIEQPTAFCGWGPDRAKRAFIMYPTRRPKYCEAAPLPEGAGTR
jgi:hypothetical protein